MCRVTLTETPKTGTDMGIALLINPSSPKHKLSLEESEASGAWRLAVATSLSHPAPLLTKKTLNGHTEGPSGEAHLLRGRKPIYSLHCLTQNV